MEPSGSGGVGGAGGGGSGSSDFVSLSFVLLGRARLSRTLSSSLTVWSVLGAGGRGIAGDDDDILTCVMMRMSPGSKALQVHTLSTPLPHFNLPLVHQP